MSSEGATAASPSVDLDELRARIASLGDSITLLKAKRTFATNNGGVGVDGKPWEEPMTKSQKKKLEKEKKAAAAAATAGGGGGGGSGGKPANEANAAKKAAKKAEAKAKKAAMKAA